ncbi:hypothetical protein U1Q18_017405, partial [Sarracenia purpurea var. burkii]
WCDSSPPPPPALTPPPPPPSPASTQGRTIIRPLPNQWNELVLRDRGDGASEDAEHVSGEEQVHDGVCEPVHLGGGVVKSGRFHL